MIEFSNILQMLSDNGWSTYRLQKEKRLSNGVIISIRAKKPLTTVTIDKLCELCNCQPGDLMHYVPDEQGE